MSTRALSSTQAAEYLAPFSEEFQRKGKRIGMDVDAQVLTYGHGGNGAVVFPGVRCEFAELADARGSTFVDGDLVVDGWVENVDGLVFVRGNLIAHSLYNRGYLVVAGELCVTRFFGEDERYGTYVLGDAAVAQAVFWHNHHFDVWGECHVGEEVSDEREGEAGVRKTLEEWNAVSDVRAGLRDWAATQARLPEEWASRHWAPKPPPVVLAPPPPAPPSAIVSELARWLDECKLPQREQLVALRNEWLARIGPDDRAAAQRIIKRAINSKKLLTERDELLRMLD